MQFTAVILLVSCMQVAATGLSQSITFSCKEVPLQKVIAAVTEQTGMLFVYTPKDVRNAKPVSIDAHRVPVKTFLERALNNQYLAFTIEGNTVFIRRKSQESLRVSGSSLLSAPPINVRGRIVNEKGDPVAGATVQVKGKNVMTTTNENGEFLIKEVEDNAILVVTAINIESFEWKLTGKTELFLKARLKIAQEEEVEILSTGYQQIGKATSTGSVAVVSNSLLNRSVSTDIISRLADVVPGLIFNRVGAVKPGSQTNISIRGLSTLFGKADPLIVLDNFPFTGDINTINPNDIESVTVLKDAASASIWGAQSGNGVIVLTSKKGKASDRVSVSFTANTSVAEKPDQFYFPLMSVSDFIDVEQKLFANGYYNSSEINPNRLPLSSVVDLLIAKRDGLIPSQEADASINALRHQDFRHDINRFFYQHATLQQYALNISGGGSKNRFYISGGYDQSKASTVGNSSDRFTLSFNNKVFLLGKKLEWDAAVFFTSLINKENPLGLSGFRMSTTQPVNPYARMTDDSGNPVSIVHRYRQSFVDESQQNGLLDWNFRPLDEIGFADVKRSAASYRINTGLQYTVLPGLNVQALYQYGQTNSGRKERKSVESWAVRDLINRFTIISPSGIVRPVPMGDILNVSDTKSSQHFVRGQINYSKQFHQHQLTAIAGTEWRKEDGSYFANRYYGYDATLGTSQTVDYLSYFTSYVNPSSRFNRIPVLNSIEATADRNISYYTNAVYEFDQRYIFSASARIDKANIFGVKTNQKKVPLYSVGAGWNIHKEKFYALQYIPYLKLRMTYGYNGNVDKTLSGFTTANYFSATGSTDLPFAIIRNPPNPQLRWERIRMINFGLDFVMADKRISGSVDYYLKKGIDLIGDAILAPQTGASAFRGNVAQTKGNGMDIVLNTIPIDKKLKWYSQLLVSFAQDKVSKYLIKSTSVSYDYFTGSSTIPTEGKSFYGIYSYPWAGLDPSSGDPQGYSLDGSVTKDYTAIFFDYTADDLNYHGSSRPVVYGGFRNTLSLYGFSLSANVSFRLKYYFRKPTVSFNQVLSAAGGHGDYSLRWQKPGDEQISHVPSVPESPNLNRDLFYAYSNALVERGDHIRLQDIRLSYKWSPGGSLRNKMKSVELFVYASNLGILWKMYGGTQDPDYMEMTIPPTRNIAVGFRTDF